MENNKCSITGNESNIQHKLNIDTSYYSIFDLKCESIKEITRSEEVLVKTLLFWKTLSNFKPDDNITNALKCIENCTMDGQVFDWNDNVLA